jgi:restriction system protein
MPSHAMMAWPALLAMRRSDDPSTNAEVLEAVADDLALDGAQRTLARGKSRRTVLDYRLAWSRTLLRTIGAIENVGPGLWAVTEAGQRTTEADVEAYVGKMLANLAEHNRNKTLGTH